MSPVDEPAAAGRRVPGRGALRTEFAFVLPARLRRRRGHRPSRRGHAPGHGARRDPPAARSARPRERGVPDGAPAVAGDHPAGHLSQINAGTIEGMFASDLAFLQDLYRRVNQEGTTQAPVTCPACGHEFAVDLGGGRLGGS